MQSAGTLLVDRTSSSNNNNYWMMAMIQPWWWMRISPSDMADIYARSISAMTDSVAAGTRMATNMLFAGIEASRATTNYARHHSKEMARLTQILRSSLGITQKTLLVGCNGAAMAISQQEQENLSRS
jgi:hypothetical protein